MAAYAHPETLVDTGWVADHRNDKNVAIVEVDVDTTSYDQGHVPGGLGWNWNQQLCDTHQRDILSKEQFEKLMSESGIGTDTTVVLYGDNNNWFACWAFWQMKIYGHKDVRIMNGGRRKWIEEGRDLTTAKPQRERTQYRAADPDHSIRAWLPDVRKGLDTKTIDLVDVRSPAEFTGEILSPPGLPETCQRGGHIPTAKSIPWGKACNEDGTFKSREELVKLYGDQGIQGERPIVAYCRIGERSSHSWYVLRYLLGYDKVKNYDGSWTEWGNLVGAQIEKP